MTAHYWQKRKEVFVYLGLLSIAGLMLYLSPSCGALGVFLTGTGARLSTSKPADTMYSVNSDRSLFKCVNETQEPLKTGVNVTDTKKYIYNPSINNFVFLGSLNKLKQSIKIKLDLNFYCNILNICLNTKIKNEIKIS